MDTSSVRVSELAHTARFVCTTDADHNQIASFYAGAMSEAREIELQPVVERLGGLDLVVVSPNDPAAMLRHTAECRARGLPFAADPSQQLARMEGPEIRALVVGAKYLLCNEYEAGLIEAKTGWSAAELAASVECWVVTRGAAGCSLFVDGRPAAHVPTVPEVCKADPTGVGDGFRAGFLAGVGWGLSLERAAQLGCLLATYVIETVGPQEYQLERGSFLQRFSGAYGAEATAELEIHLLPSGARPGARP